MYGWGEDYHIVVKDKLFAMADRMRAEWPGAFGFKVCVDTAPLLEREVAAAAGIGWIGKNTMVLDPQLGSYFFLGAIVTTLDLAPDEPLPDRCGTCTACLEACPTDAFPAPYEMDASRCISYLTIEHRDAVSENLQPLMSDWIFGCDVCQQVCPYNRRAPVTTEPRFAIRDPGPEPLLDDILSWTQEDYRRLLRGSAMKRAKLDALQRNARIAMQNAARSSKGNRRKAQHREKP
jgi:epoxyqueuosine reductase